MITITEDDVRAQFEGITETFPDELNSDLFYTSGCLVGEILAGLGFDLGLLENTDDDGACADNVDWSEYGLDIAPAALRLLNAAQDKADTGVTWGDSCKTALLA